MYRNLLISRVRIRSHISLISRFSFPFFLKHSHDPGESQCQLETQKPISEVRYAQMEKPEDCATCL